MLKKILTLCLSSNGFLVNVDFSLLRNNLVFIFVFIYSLFLMSCKPTSDLMKKEAFLVDIKAKQQTKYLYHRIKEISKLGYAFGHQDATAYGIGWKNDGTMYKSDVQEVSGQYPAVYGFDIGHIELDHEHNLDTVNFKLMKKLIKKAHKSGGIVTISWHPDNPLSNKSSWDTTSTVKQILRGGILHDKYKNWLKRVANFMNGLKKFIGPQVPIVFRPFHEMNGDWFWWGAASCTEEEYKRLWRETVYILKDEYKVHNLLYLYSPNTLNTESEFLKYYPGDEYVDMLGVDIYQYGTEAEYMNTLKRDITVLKKVGAEKDKPFALSETGFSMLKGVPQWWTKVLDKSVSDSGIAWALFWRNAWMNHFYVPYKGQETSKDFLNFKNLPHVLFLDEIQKIK